MFSKKNGQSDPRVMIHNTNFHQDEALLSGVELSEIPLDKFEFEFEFHFFLNELSHLFKCLKSAFINQQVIKRIDTSLQSLSHWILL